MQTHKNKWVQVYLIKTTVECDFNELYPFLNLYSYVILYKCKYLDFPIAPWIQLFKTVVADLQSCECVAANMNTHIMQWTCALNESFVRLNNIVLALLILPVYS